MRPPSMLQLRSAQTRGTRRLGLGLSIAAHLAVLVMALIRLGGEFSRVWSAGDAALRPSAGGGGGGREAYISLSAPQATPVRPPPRTTPTPQAVTPPPPTEIPAPEPDTVSSDGTTAAADAAAPVGTGNPGAGGGQGGGVGTGEGPGSGPGSGPGTGEHGQGRPPQLRHQVFYLEKTPKELRGIPIRVTFSVDEDGRVAGVAIEPPIQDRKFADGFRETMMQYRFRPALGPDGSPVAAEIELTFTY